MDPLVSWPSASTARGRSFSAVSPHRELAAFVRISCTSPPPCPPIRPATGRRGRGTSVLRLRQRLRPSRYRRLAIPLGHKHLELISWHENLPRFESYLQDRRSGTACHGAASTSRRLVSAGEKAHGRAKTHTLVHPRTELPRNSRTQLDANAPQTGSRCSKVLFVKPATASHRPSGDLGSSVFPTWSR